jgi:arylsulfatase A-like enzyme
MAVGLAGGWLEIGLLWLRTILAREPFIGPLAAGRGWYWLVPLSGLICGMLAGLIPAGLSLWAPRAGSAWALRIALALGFAGPLMLVRRLHPAAAVILAVGLGFQLAIWLDRRSVRYRRWIIGGGGALGIILAGCGIWSVASSFAGAQSGEIRRAAADPRLPNVLLIVLDTVRRDALEPAAGDGSDPPRPFTPRMRSLAERGIRFDQARSAASWTLPSHAVMFTGRWRHELNVGPETALNTQWPTLAERLGALGHATGGFVGNTLYAHAGTGLARGFDRYEDYVIGPYEVISASGIGKLLARGLRWEGTRKDARLVFQQYTRWLDAGAARRPFFAFVNLFDAHDPYLPPSWSGWRDRRAPTRAADWDLLRNWSERDRRSITPAQRELAWQGYAACATALDDAVGWFLDDLKSRGLAERTLVIVTSDHGEQFGEHGFYGHGASLHREELDVPLIFAWPGELPEGLVIPAPVSLRDLGATILSLIPGSADAGAGAAWPGRSLARFWAQGGLLRERELEPEGMLAEVDIAQAISEARRYVPAAGGRIVAYQEGTWVYMLREDGTEELYNHASDPGERVNLAGVPNVRERQDALRLSLIRLRGSDPGLPRPDGNPPKRPVKL